MYSKGLLGLLSLLLIGPVNGQECDSFLCQNFQHNQQLIPNWVCTGSNINTVQRDYCLYIKSECSDSLYLYNFLYRGAIGGANGNLTYVVLFKDTNSIDSVNALLKNDSCFINMFPVNPLDKCRAILLGALADSMYVDKSKGLFWASIDFYRGSGYSLIGEEAISIINPFVDSIANQASVVSNDHVLGVMAVSDTTRLKLLAKRSEISDIYPSPNPIFVNITQTQTMKAKFFNKTNTTAALYSLEGKTLQKFPNNKYAIPYVKSNNKTIYYDNLK